MKHIASAKALLNHLGDPPKFEREADGGTHARERVAHEDRKMRESAKQLLALAGLSAGKKVVKGLVGPLFEILENQRKARGANCGLSAATAVEYFSRAGIVIASAVQECATQRAVRHTEVNSLFDSVLSPCTAQVSEILSSLIWAASWLSLAISQCAHHANIEAVCAGTIEVLVAGIAEAVTAGEVMRQTCRIPPKTPTFVAPFPIRRLQAEDLAGNPAFTPELAAFDAKVAMSQEALDVEMAMCVQDAVQAATMLGQFGVAFDNTIYTCPLQEFSTITDNACVVTVSLTMNRLFEATAHVIAAISHCGTSIGARLGAECGAASVQMASLFAGLPASAAGMNVACPGTQASLPDSFGVLANPLLKLSALGRRLEDLAAQRNATAAEPAAALPFVV